MPGEIGLGVRISLQAILAVCLVAVIVFAWRAWVAWQRLRRVLSRGDAPGVMGSAEALAGLDRSALAIATGRTFTAVHGALALGDVTPVGDRLTSTLYAQLAARCTQGPRPIALDFRSAEVTAAWREHELEHALVRLTGALANGGGMRVEEWRLVRTVGDEGWKVAGIARASAR